MMPPIIQQEFSALKLLEKMQRDGAPKEGGRGQEARAAIELIVQAATDSVSAVAYPLRESVILITTKIAQRFLLDKELIFMVRRAYDPTSKLIGNGLVAQLLKGGRDLAQLICAEAPPLLALGLTADNIGKLAYKLGFLEIRDIFSDPIFYNKDRIVPNSVLLIVNCADPRGLYQRIKSTYDIPALDGLGFAKRAFFVLNPTLAAARIESAKTQFTSGAKTNTAVGSATATKDQMQWFDQYKLRPGYKDAQVALLRVAKLQEKERAGIIIEIEELVVLGASHLDAINIVLTKDYDPKIKCAIRLALAADLTSTAARAFALSDIAQTAPGMRIGNVKLLKALPLDWSDDLIVRLVIGASFTKARPGSALLQERKDIIEALMDNLKADFRIDRSNPLQYEARRLLARLNHEQIADLYSVFFDSKDYLELNDSLLRAEELERAEYGTAMRFGKESLLDATIKVGKLKDPEFDALCVELSDFLISMNPNVRAEINVVFYQWLNQHAIKYYKKYVGISPKVVEILINQTIKNYDPKKLSAGKKAETGLFQAFAGNIKHFYLFLIKHSLIDSKPAIRAYKLFVALRTTKSNIAAETVPDAEIWSELEGMRPDLSAGIVRARSEYERVSALQASARK